MKIRISFKTPDAGITLCDAPDGCHAKAEVFYRTGTALPGFSPEELFKLIDSSLTTALKASEKLS
jgi:hypothetical protein